MLKGALLTLTASAAAAASLATGAPAQSLADIEAANEQLVRDFFAAASTDLGYVHTFLAEDVAFQYEDLRVEGRDAYIARAEPKMSAVGGYSVDPLRLVTIGDTVLNERVDIATLKDGQEIRLMVASAFLIADGAIAEWREYPQPAGAQPLAEIEAANERLVRDFFAYAASVDFDNPDPASLRRYLAESFTYQYQDLRIEGLETYIAQQTPQMALVASASTELLRVAAIGNTVLNERIDIATLKSGQQHRWHVSSVLLIADGKIAEWRDYPLPEAPPAP